LDVFQGLKSGVPSGCLGKTSIFKIIMIDDVTLWSKVISIHANSLDFINFISQTDDIQNLSARTVGVTALRSAYDMSRPSVVCL